MGCFSSKQRIFYVPKFAYEESENGETVSRVHFARVPLLENLNNNLLYKARVSAIPTLRIN